MCIVTGQLNVVVNNFFCCYSAVIRLECHYASHESDNEVRRMPLVFIFFRTIFREQKGIIHEP